MKNFGVLLIFFLCFSQVTLSQDSSAWRRNSVKLDITSHVLYRNAMILSYERTTKPNESFSITGGYQEFPKLLSLGSGIIVKDDRKRTGFKFGGEYRFYLKKENKFSAPRGVYIGPYFSILNFNNESTIEVDNNGTPEQAVYKSKFNVLNIGFQLGYQFVLNNRWTIDLVFVGPSVTNYRAKLDLDGSFTFDEEDIQNEIVQHLIDQFPALGDLINDQSVTASGQADTWSYGYRYQLQVGYHFGRKKK